MNTKFTAAAKAIAEHFKQAESQRGEPFRDTFTNPMNNDAVTPNFVGIPLALLRALVAAQIPEMFLADGVTSNPEWLTFKHSISADCPATEAKDAARFVPMVSAMLDLEGADAKFLMTAEKPTTIDEARALIDQMIAASEKGGAA